MRGACERPLDGAARPYLPRHVIFRFDALRERWLLLAPERVLVPEPTAVAIIERLDGQRTLAEIAAELAAVYDAPVAVILDDALEMLADLARRGFLRLSLEETSDE